MLEAFFGGLGASEECLCTVVLRSNKYSREIGVVLKQGSKVFLELNRPV